MGRLVALTLALLAAFVLRAEAQAEKRVALVIGNGTYAEAGTLANPVNDAADVAAKLRQIGFTVIEGGDLGKRDMERKIGEFSDALTGAGTSLFYYAGHGLQVDGRNFIVPVDARLDQPAKLRLEAVQIDDILDIMESQTPTSLVFLDACRNNPFARSLSRSATTRSAVALAGLAQFDTTRGSFIAFSTAPGAVALDGTGRNSPFAAALLSHIAEPGQSINDLMIAVRRDVVAQTNNAQRPWEQGSLLARFEFVPGAASVATAAPAAPAASQMASMERTVAEPASVSDFLRQHYLAPDARDMAATVAKVYAERATIFGSDYGQADLTRIKADWFAQWASWTLTMDEASLKVSPRGERSADAAFVMSYDYAPREAGKPRTIGRTLVKLGLEMGPDGWRVASESSEAAP